MLAMLVPAGAPRAEPAAILRPVFRVDWKWLSMAAMVVLGAGLWYVVQMDLRSPVLQETRSRPADTNAPGPAAAPAAGLRADALPAQPATGVVGGAAGSAPSAGNRQGPAGAAEGVSAEAAVPSLRDEKSSDGAKEAAKQVDSRAYAELRRQPEKLEKRGEPTSVTAAQQTPATGPSQASGPSQTQAPASNELAQIRTAEEAARRREAEQRLEASAPAPAPAPPPATVTAGSPRAPSVTQDKVSATERDRLAAAAFRTAGTVTGFADPQRRVHWRIAGGDRIETSNDGTTWTERHREPAGGLGVGTAPSTGVAWVAGARGLVLRYVAPGPWTRVARPTDDSIVSISASSADVARVRTASGLQFETRDAGTTWTPVP
jgi:hypothetical protein